MLVGTARTGESFQLGSHLIRNRILFGPVRTNLTKSRMLGPGSVDFLAQRLHGGVGVIVSEELAVDEQDWPYEYSPLAVESAPSLGQLANIASPLGSVIIGAIGHTGGEGSSAYSQRHLSAPSDVVDSDNLEPPVPMSIVEIHNLIAAFASGARALTANGVHGVEVNAGTRSILRQFLSPLTNLRNDAYGNDRALLLKEIVHAVRASIGDSILGLRLSFDEFAPWGGLDSRTSCDAVASLTESLDYIVVTSGGPFTKSRQRPNYRHGTFVNRAILREVREHLGHTSVALVAQGSIVTADEANLALSEGAALVEMTRALIADPQLVAPTRDGHPRLCLLCNQGCAGYDARNVEISCLVNPRGPRLDTTPRRSGGPESPQCVTPPRRVHVIGGGIAGLEAASRLVVSLPVTLYETSDHLGGIAAALSRTEAGEWIKPLVVDLIASVTGSDGINIRLGRTITGSDELDDLQAHDIVVVAMGASRIPPTSELHGPSRATTYQLAENPQRFTGRTAIVNDPVGDPHAITAVDLVSSFARHTSVVTSDPVYASRTSSTGDLIDANSRILRRSGTIDTLSYVAHNGNEQSMEIKGRFTKESRNQNADLHIDTTWRVSSLTGELAARVERDERWFAVGDALSPRGFEQAILDVRMLVDGILRSNGE